VISEVLEGTVIPQLEQNTHRLEGHERHLGDHLRSLETLSHKVETQSRDIQASHRQIEELAAQIDQFRRQVAVQQQERKKPQMLPLTASDAAALAQLRRTNEAMERLIATVSNARRSTDERTGVPHPIGRAGAVPLQRVSERAVRGRSPDRR
jgi:peptidoglycan hydrolase CwlO-like protein